MARNPDNCCWRATGMLMVSRLLVGRIATNWPSLVAALFSSSRRRKRCSLFTVFASRQIVPTGGTPTRWSWPPMEIFMGRPFMVVPTERVWLSKSLQMGHLQFYTVLPVGSSLRISCKRTMGISMEQPTDAVCLRPDAGRNSNDAAHLHGQRGLYNSHGFDSGQRRKLL